MAGEDKTENSPTLLQEKRAGIGLTLGPRPGMAKPKSQPQSPEKKKEAAAGPTGHMISENILDKDFDYNKIPDTGSVNRMDGSRPPPRVV